MNEFEQRQLSRAERMRARAANLRNEAESRREKSHKLIGIMNGSPILVGHHSEKRHRRDIDRIQSDMTRSFEADREAEALERRADNVEHAVENQSVIYADDPDALSKLRTKLEGLEKAHALMVAINRAIGRRREPDAIKKALEESGLGLKDSTIATFCCPDALGNYGVPSYRVTNSNAEIRRTKARIAELERKATEAPPEPETHGAVTIREEENRVRIIFPGKPDEQIRSRLKSRGFRWSPTAGAWQRHASPGAWNDARWAVK
jgi:hypothetical protein